MGGADRRDERGSWYCLKVRGSQRCLGHCSGGYWKADAAHTQERPQEMGGLILSHSSNVTKDITRVGVGFGEKKTG